MFFFIQVTQMSSDVYASMRACAAVYIRFYNCLWYMCWSIWFSFCVRLACIKVPSEIQPAWSAVHVRTDMYRHVVDTVDGRSSTPVPHKGHIGLITIDNVTMYINIR